MANAPEEILAIWKRMEERKIGIPAEVWELWAPSLRALDEISAFVTNNNGGPIPVEQARAITHKTGDIQRFIRSIKPASDGQSRVEDGRIFLDPDALELVVHHVGNDLYVIALVADVPKNDPQPLPADEALSIVARVQVIKEFVAKLKGQTQ